MIKEFEFYHGAVLAKLFHESKQSITIELFPSKSNASYVVNKSAGLFIKHSSKRLSPWRFSFSKEHRDEILDMKNKLKNVFLLLVCGDDGVVALNFDELKTILDETHAPVEWISASRNRNQEYTIKGSEGALKYKISRKDFPRKLFETSSKEKIANKRNVFFWLK